MDVAGDNSYGVQMTICRSVQGVLPCGAGAVLPETHAVLPAGVSVCALLQVLPAAVTGCVKKLQRVVPAVSCPPVVDLAPRAAHHCCAAVVAEVHAGALHALLVAGVCAPGAGKHLLVLVLDLAARYTAAVCAVAAVHATNNAPPTLPAASEVWP